MALNDSQKASLLFKQANGVAETTTARDFFEEPYPGRPLVLGEQIWNESNLIPTTAPGGADGVTTGVVKRYIDKTMTAVPGTTNSFYLASLKDSIPFNYGDGSYNYVIKSSTDTVIPFGQGDWIVNNAAGTLTFYGTTPANMPPKISFYQYVGAKGAANSAAMEAAVDVLRQEINAEIGAANGIAPLGADTKVPANNTQDLGDLNGTLSYAKLVIADGDLTIAKTSGLQTALDSKLNLSGGTMTGTLAMGTNKITTSYVPLNGQDVVNKTALDNAITGVTWKVPVTAFNLLGNLDVAGINGLTPARGDQYVLTDSGTLTAGSLAVVTGDLVEYSGTAWFVLVAAVGGFPPAGTRAVLAGYSGTVGAPYTNATDQDKIAQFAGDSLTAVLTSEAANGVSFTVVDGSNASFFDNASYVYEGSIPSGHWVQFNGAGQISAGVGLIKSGNTLSVALGAGIAELPSGEVGVDLYTDGGLFTTENGTSSSNNTAAKLKVKTDGSIIGVDSSGVHIINSSITGTKVADGTLTYAKLNLSDDDIPQLKVNGLVTALSGKEPTITAGTSGQYYRGDKQWATLDTAAVAENASYLYFTAARAKAATVSDSITDAITDVAPSQNAVYDALALKADDSVTVKSVNGVTPVTGNVGIDTDDVPEGATNQYFTASRAKSAAVADSITDGITDVAPSQNAVHDALLLKVDTSERNFAPTNDNAGAITIRQFVYVKSNGAVDLAKADATGTCSTKIGIVADASIASAAAGNITFQRGVPISGFTGLTPGGKVWLSPGTAGGYTQTIPDTVGHSIVELGEALTASIMEFNPKGAILIAS